ncbi:MAG: ribosomal-processing cysteine protease Prp [Eubacteriales bacterium]|nr:ribosomal-processing cysteine protease Prp [Lachnospiraceae bacterium]MDO5127220.1 ribosomal-processing cysteine protease Prp [Eubacteriales bacterium]
MIKANFYRNSNQDIIGFRVSGHAGYAKYNQDIVCAAVSALVTSTINSVEVHSETAYVCEQGASGFWQFKFKEVPDEIGRVLIHTLLMALEGIRDSYGEKFLQVHYKEV